MIETIIIAVLGALVATCGFAAVFFFRFWWQSRDRFFLMFAGAMLLLAANWVGVVVADARHEPSSVIYVVRLCAFVLIVAAIIDKNSRS